MKVRIKSIKEIRKIGIETEPGFITDDRFEEFKFSSSHSMEYYCDKVIELDEHNYFDTWYWVEWMYDVAPEIPLLEVEE